MSIYNRKRYLQQQISQLQEFLKLEQDHPFLLASDKARIEMLQNELDQLPDEQDDSKVTLLFYGEPVVGSVGIDAEFTVKTLFPFQQMVSAAYNDRRSGSLGKRGVIKNKNASSLVLTALPKGSFGFELTHIKNEESDLFSEIDVAKSLAFINDIICAAASNDTDFSENLEQANIRIIKNLQRFLKSIYKSNAGIKIETGTHHCSLTPQHVEDAYIRVSQTRTEKDNINLKCIFKGGIIDGQFELETDNHTTIRGKFDEKVPDENVIRFIKKFTNMECIANTERTTIILPNESKKFIYDLISLEEIPSND